jgi:hypothetical protein
MRHKTSLSLLASIGLTTVAAVPAFAATVHFGSPEACFTNSIGTVICSYQDGQYNLTETPNGNYIYVGQYTAWFTLTSSDGSSTSTQTITEKFRYITKQGESQVQRLVSSQTFDLDGGGCTFTSDYVVANGEIRHDDSEIVCY